MKEVELRMNELKNIMLLKNYMRQMVIKSVRL